MEGFGPDSVFATPAEDNGQYRISRSLVRSAEDSTVPLTRVKCLVSMTTPHDIRLHGSAVTPAFVEFDTSLEGFGLVSMSIKNWAWVFTYLIAIICWPAFSFLHIQQTQTYIHLVERNIHIPLKLCSFQLDEYT